MAALLAGLVAIIVNSLALAAADYVPLATAHGGLLRLLVLWFGQPFLETGLTNSWLAAGLPGVGQPAFQSGFHVLVGLGMALAYAFALEPLLPGPAWFKGGLYAAALWLLNAVFVLPVTGEGFAGRVHLTFAGMLWFACAHALFFILLAVGYARLLARRKISRPVE